jgi:L-lactate dehydrogenase complex protein LldF
MSTAEFRSRIRTAIADDQLQTALDDNARRRSGGRAAAFASLPDLAASRRAARAVRAETIERLYELLDQFTSKAESNGMRVHRAADAAEARLLVMEIAEGARANGQGADRRPLLFAKSKSMVSEEIELNAEVERRGHKVVETDLGEYIVQLRGEKPAHIITPAVHLQRHQIGALFEDKLGLAYTEDIPTLTAAARAALRRIFLSADVGISGVNFGVAETGGICIVTNEGNGRMVTTLPRVHIALMGMERLVPTLQDLAPMLSLLPRSATGQKLSVYTQLIHGPRRDGEQDGAHERHVVIVDNGRSQLWESDLREALYCIRCGACLNACPVFREIGGHAYVGRNGAAAPYPGPIGSVISPGLFGVHEFGQLAQASSLCGACKDACPVDIDLPTMLARVRAGSPEARNGISGVALAPGTRAALKAFTYVAGAPGLFGMLQRLAGLAGRVLSPGADWMRLPTWTGWGLSKDIRRPAVTPFRDRWPALNAQVNREAGKVLTTPKVQDMKLEEGSWNGKGADGESADTVALLGRFVSELEKVGAQVVRLGQAGLTDHLIEELHARGIEKVMCWDAVDGLSIDRLRTARIKTFTLPDPEIRVGVTGCVCAIADTGTVLLTGKPGNPLTASLLPETHIVVVRAAQLVHGLEVALLFPELRDASASVMITGPSRTADIEMTLTIGVHGPRELLVLIAE